VLEPVYAAKHEWQKLVRIYKIRLEAADVAPLRLSLTRRIARLYEEQLEDLDGAFTWYGKVFHEEPGDRVVRDQLARLANVENGWQRLARVYEDWLSDVQGHEGEVGREVLRILASIYHARLDDVDGAKSCYKRLLAIDPQDEVAFVNLEGLLQGARRFTDLYEVWREAADSTLDMERKKTLLYKQAALQEGDLETVAELLGRPFSLHGPVVHGVERGKVMGFPTANIGVGSGMALPPFGVYVTRAHIGAATYDSVTNIGRRPTFDNGERTVEVYIMGFDGDLYGAEVRIDVLKRLRGEVRFASVEELAEHIRKDVEDARAYLASHR